MTLKINFVLYTFIMILIYSISSAYDQETEKIMPFISAKSYCLKCHKEKKSKNRLGNLTKSCDIYCVKCHKIKDRHHKVGLIMKDQLSQELSLTENKRIACFTCHDLNIKRYDNSSWRAESLFESMFRIQSKYKTYYLVIKNNQGQLCKKCH